MPVDQLVPWVFDGFCHWCIWQPCRRSVSAWGICMFLLAGNLLFGCARLLWCPGFVRCAGHGPPGSSRQARLPTSEGKPPDPPADLDCGGALDPIGPMGAHGLLGGNRDAQVRRHSNVTGLGNDPKMAERFRLANYCTPDLLMCLILCGSEVW